MEILDIWKDVHHKIPYGIVYAKQPSELAWAFVNIIQIP